MKIPNFQEFGIAKISEHSVPFKIDVVGSLAVVCVQNLHLKLFHKGSQ